MRRLTAITAALALAFAAGCGGDEEGEPIPAQDAESLIDVLGLIEGQVESGACSGAEAKVRQDLQPKVQALPEAVDADVRSTLEDGVDRLLELIEDECGEEEPTDTTETEAPPETEETQPPETQETQPPETQETQPPETQETQPPPTTDEQPPPPDDGGGGAPAPDEGAGTGTGGRAAR